jgi:hypothetical protein
VADDSVHFGSVGEEGDDLYLAALMQNMSTAKLPHFGQSMGSTSYTLRIIAAFRRPR